MAAAAPTIYGKEKIIKWFEHTNEPYWKLYTIEGKSPIQKNTDIRDINKSLTFFKEMLDTISEKQVYIIDTFGIKEEQDKKDHRFIHPSNSIAFTLDENYGVAPTISGTGQQNNSQERSNHSQGINMGSYLNIMQENSDLKVNLNYYKNLYEKAEQENKLLHKEIEELESEIEALEDELEEQEEEAMAGTTGVEGALADLIQKHGGTVIENLVNKNKKGKLTLEEIPEEINGDEDEEAEDGNIEMNGIAEGNVKTMEDVVRELRKHDPNLFKHLYMLLNIAEKKPSTFKMLLSQLENL